MLAINLINCPILPRHYRGCHGRDHMVVGFTTTCAISVYHHESCEIELHSWQGVPDIALFDKVCK